MYRKISNKELAEKARLLSQLQTEVAALQAEVDDLKAEITGELDRREAEELAVPGFLIRWTKYASSRFDSRAFKKDHPKLSEEYTRETTACRFSLAAN